jgi:hypothetical protein
LEKLNLDRNLILNVFRANGTNDEITLTAWSDGMKAAYVTIQSEQ